MDHDEVTEKLHKWRVAQEENAKAWAKLAEVMKRFSKTMGYISELAKTDESERISVPVTDERGRIDIVSSNKRSTIIGEMRRS